jgi:hypothetical protein
VQGAPRRATDTHRDRTSRELAQRGHVCTQTLPPFMLFQTGETDGSTAWGARCCCYLARARRASEVVDMASSSLVTKRPQGRVTRPTNTGHVHSTPPALAKESYEWPWVATPQTRWDAVQETRVAQPPGRRKHQKPKTSLGIWVSSTAHSPQTRSPGRCADQTVRTAWDGDSDENRNRLK